MTRERKFLLFQMRKVGDPMRAHEVECFARALGVGVDQIEAFDLTSGRAETEQVPRCDVFLFGGSGDYSVVQGGDWLDGAMDVMRRIHCSGKPTFASCWGFQAMARALGGTVIHDVHRAEIGTFELCLTEAGESDPIFGALGNRFLAQLGHEDHVVELPPNATLLASSEMSPCQAYRFDDAPIYCTQFHPELRVADLEARLRQYKRYIETIPGVTWEGLRDSVAETPASEALLSRFVEQVLN